MSTIIPGLGSSNGKIDIYGDELEAAAKSNKNVDTFLDKAKVFELAVAAELSKQIFENYVLRTRPDDIPF